MSIKNPPVNITADDRERKSGVIDSLSQIDNVNVDIQRLSRGDYQVEERVIVERKTIKDFAISIIDGRLFRQMVHMANSSSMGILILEGRAVDAADLKMTRASIQGALITVSLILGIPVLRSRDPEETAKLIVYAGRQLESIARGGIQRHGYRPKTRRRTQIYILQGLPGIGPEKAEKLLDRFGSVEAAISADRSELQTVAGIGESIASKIRWAVGEEKKPFIGGTSSPDFFSDFNPFR